MGHQIDPFAEDVGRADTRYSSNGTAASAIPDAVPRVVDSKHNEPARVHAAATTLAMDDDGDLGFIAPTLRASTLALVAFQIAYLVLDRLEYPLRFAQSCPLHLASIAVAVLAFTVTLSPGALRYWRGFSIAVFALTIACAVWIADLDRDGDVLVAMIVLFFFGGGALLPWSPRRQVAVEAIGMLALLEYSMRVGTPGCRLAIAWMTVVTAAVLSQLSSVQGERHRRKRMEQLAALTEHYRLLRHEMALRAEVALAREGDHTKLQASESMLRKVFEASPDNIAINSLVDGRFIAVNDTYEVAGYTRDDVMGSDVIALRMWRHEAQLSLFVETLRRTGHVKNMDVTQRPKNGGVDQTHLISASATEVNGEPCVISMIRDITEIKQAETNLRASHAALRKIFDATLDIIVVTRLSDGSYIDFNQQFERIGYGQQELDDSRMGKRQLWAIGRQHQEFRNRIVADGVVRNMEADFLKPDGSVMPAMVSAVRVELKGEDCVVTMVRDLTAAKEASRKLEQSVKALSESEETFRKLFDANLDSMTLGAITGTYIDVNQEFIKTTGYSREEAIGHHFTDLNMWIHPDEMVRFANQLMQTDEVRNLEVAFRMKDGSEQPMLLSAVNLDLHGQKCCLTICRGIADVKMTQRELVAAREAALAASRAKSEFLSSMSHEIRTPMNSILGMADELMETALDDEQRRYLSMVISNGHALLALINGILDLAKVESGRISFEMVEFDLKDVTEKVIETLAVRAHEKGLELMVRFAPELPELVLGDPLRLSQILINLIGNAIKFTHQGQVLVAVEHDAGTTAAGALKFTVTDTGIGIAADKRHLLFHAFSQADSSTSRKYGGSGLGLAIVSRLVALMHGTVEVASEPGKGSAFSFTAQFGMAKRIAEERARTFGDARIIVVDSNPDSRSIISELLIGQGAEVIQASSGTEAIAELRRLGSPGRRVQIVLIDIASPLQSAFNLAERLFSEGPGRLEIVMMLRTGDLTSEVGRLRALGLDNYIVKPVRRAELFAAVMRAYAGAHREPHGEKDAPAAIAAPPASAQILDRPLQILMADDSHDNRALIRAYLKKTPYRLVEAEDGQEAIDKFVAGNFDLVLMDIQMPNVDGYEAASTIRVWEVANSRRRTPIVALTASALEEAVHRTREAGCDAHITKPVKKSTLLDAIRDAVEGSASDDEGAAVANLKEETCRTE
ncbi:MAG: PAS domain S-box protein [Candidatus Binatus sp.]|uniref:PAS domain S-box protein n=1 Tax=Candidatus Binatus sp. TaxID=2811406 RepID=UPI003BAE3DD5